MIRLPILTLIPAREIREISQISPQQFSFYMQCEATALNFELKKDPPYAPPLVLTV